MTDDKGGKYENLSEEEALQELRSEEFMAWQARHRRDGEDYRGHLQNRKELISYLESEHEMSEEEIKEECSLHPSRLP